DCLRVRCFHVHLGHPLGHHEPCDRFLHSAAYREQAVVAQDAEFLVAECCGDAPATIDRKYLHFLIVEKCLVEHKGTRLLTDRAERLNVGRPWRAEGGMGVRCADDVGTSSEHGIVDVVAGRIDGAGRVAVGILHLAVGSDQHQIVNRCGAEGDSPIEQPEVVGQLRVAGRYMAVAEHTPPQRIEDAVSERTHLLAVRPFVGNRTDGAVRLDPVKRRIGIRYYVVHDMSRNLVSCFCLRNLTSLATPRRASLSRGWRSRRRSRAPPCSRPWPALDRDHRATREKARCLAGGHGPSSSADASLYRKLKSLFFLTRDLSLKRREFNPGALVKFRSVLGCT